MHTKHMYRRPANGYQTQFGRLETGRAKRSELMSLIKHAQVEHGDIHMCRLSIFVRTSIAYCAAARHANMITLAWCSQKGLSGLMHTGALRGGVMRARVICVYGTGTLLEVLSHLHTVGTMRISASKDLANR